MSDRMIDHKKQAVVARIKRLEDAINKANEYLESGKHANWNGFRPLFTSNKRDGKVLPPHRDWVKKRVSSPHGKGIEPGRESLGKT